MRTAIVTALGIVTALVGGALDSYADTPLPASTTASEPTPTPEPTPSPAGSISGRLYIDVNANGVFDGPDVPWSAPMALSGPTNIELPTSEEGLYRFDGLPPGEYGIIAATYVFAQCLPFRTFDWVGLPSAEPDTCGQGISLTTSSATVQLADNQQVSGVDFPQVPPTTISGRLWLNGEAAPAGTEVAVTVGGVHCWQVATSRDLTPADVAIPAFTIDLKPTDEATCQHGDISLLINGRPLPISVPWNHFWIGQLFSRTAGRLADSSDFMMPSFMGLRGRVAVAEGAALTGRDQPVAEGAVIRALIGNTECGRAQTKTLGEGTLEWLNVFGLIVPPDELKPGCGQEGAPLSFCIDASAARELAGHSTTTIPPISQPAPLPALWKPGLTRGVALEPTSDPCPLQALGFPPLGFPLLGSGDPASPRLDGVLLVLAGASLVFIGISAALSGARLRRPAE